MFGTLVLTTLLAAVPAGAPPGDKGFVPRQTDAPGGQKRVALIIGNGAYKNAPLKNPARDAKAMAETLASLGFDVDAHFDLDRAGMLRALRRFADRLDPDSVALFYYSGHGVTHDGRTYMLPVATDIRTAADVELEGVPLQRVTARLEEAGSRLNFVVLDACRNNPLVYGGQRTGGGGLAFTTAPTGTLIAYATAPGQTAADGRGKLSPYTWALIEEIKVPGRPVEEVFKAVRRRVRRASDGAQVPWESSSLEGRFVFVPEGWTPTPIAPDENEALAAAVDAEAAAAASGAPKTKPRRKVLGAADDEDDEEVEVAAADRNRPKAKKRKRKTNKPRRLTAAEKKAKKEAERVEARWRASKSEELEAREAEQRDNTALYGFSAAGSFSLALVSLLVSSVGWLVLSTPSDPAALTVPGTNVPNPVAAIWIGAACGGCVSFVASAAAAGVLTYFSVDNYRGANEAEEQLRRLQAEAAPATTTTAMAY